MAEILQFDKVNNDRINTLSFSVNSGDLLVLQVNSPEAKASAIDLALGELIPDNGRVLLLGREILSANRGSTGWIPAAGGLISNLKTWENITLPLWYHGNHLANEAEKSIAYWLKMLNLEEQEWEKFMASPVARLLTWERKLAGLMRGLVLAPRLLLVDAGLFDDIDESKAKNWVAVLEKFVHEAEDRAVLVVTDSTSKLPWKLIE